MMIDFLRNIVKTDYGQFIKLKWLKMLAKSWIEFINLDAFSLILDQVKNANHFN